MDLRRRCHAPPDRSDLHVIPDSQAESSSHLWFGKNPMTLQSNDLSAVRAFILLLEEALEQYAAVPQAIWEKWAPVIVGLRLPGCDDQPGNARQLLQSTLAKAPAAFINAVRRMLHLEKVRMRASSDVPAVELAHPFPMLSDLEGCMDDEGLKPPYSRRCRSLTCGRRSMRRCWMRF